MADGLRAENQKNPFDALRRFARQAPAQAGERCDLCGEAIGPEHQHLLNLPTRQVQCACRACALLFDTPSAGGGTRRLIPTRILHLTNFSLTDPQWKALQIPVNMAFFCFLSPDQRMAAFYPGPMGAAESSLPLTAWEALAEENPILREMEPDVEALLIHRGREYCDVFLVPIDECYKLVGRIRLCWSGISGGSEVQEEIARFFADLKSRQKR